jgi:PIN domain nuclease of toxin-antitoxin system
MRLLLDTQLLMWTVMESGRVNATTRAILEDGGNEVLFSAASLWEIALKASLNRADFPFDPGEVLTSALGIGFVELPVVAGVAIHVAKLPLYHLDPFDRLLIAQAMYEPVRFYTADAMLAQYSELVTLIR